MQNIFAIARREFASYFNSPIAYLVVSIYIILSGALFFNGLFLQGQADMRAFFDQAPLLLFIIVPFLTMRLLAEERAQGTLELLLSMPVTDWQPGEQVDVDLRHHEQVVRSDGALADARHPGAVLEPRASEPLPLVQHRRRHPGGVEEVDVPVDHADATGRAVVVGGQEVHRRPLRRDARRRQGETAAAVAFRRLPQRAVHAPVRGGRQERHG